MFRYYVVHRNEHWQKERERYVTTINSINHSRIHENGHSQFRPGDNVKVHVRIKEGNRERIQIFEGLVIKRRGAGISETFTVRKISYGVGVERTFPIHSPNIAQIEVVRRGKVRRAKLHYIRKLSAKAARIKELR